MANRYDLWTYYGEFQEDKHDNGDWVKYDDHAAELATLRAEVERIREALEPSGDTKAAYMGEIRDPDTKRYVSWSAIKMIMKMISDRATKEALK